MDKPLTREMLYELIATNLYANLEDVVSEARFMEDLGVESLMAAELMMDLEDQFEIEIPNDLGQFQTVGSVVDFVLEAVAEKADPPAAKTLEVAGSSS